MRQTSEVSKLFALFHENEKKAAMILNVEIYAGPSLDPEVMKVLIKAFNLTLLL